MAVSTQMKNNTGGAILLKDGTGTPVTLNLTCDRGDYAISGLGPKLNEVVKMERRGKFVTAAYAGRKYPSVSFTCYLTGFTAAAAEGPVSDFVLKRGAYSSNISTLGTGRPYTIDIGYTVEGTEFGDSADHSFITEDCLLTDWSFGESADGSTITLTFDVLGAITGDLALTQIS